MLCRTVFDRFPRSCRFLQQTARFPPNYRPPVIVDPVEHRSSFIFLHDLDEDPNKYRSIFTLLGDLPNSIRAIFPYGTRCYLAFLNCKYDNIAPINSEAETSSWSSSDPSVKSSLNVLIANEFLLTKNVFIAGYDIYDGGNNMLKCVRFGEGASLALELG